MGLNASPGTPESKWETRRRNWALLKQLGAVPLELARVDFIRDVNPRLLLQPGTIEDLMLVLGLNDEGLAEIPDHLRGACGVGLRIWQYPIQFGPYLRYLAGL